MGSTFTKTATITATKGPVNRTLQSRDDRIVLCCELGYSIVELEKAAAPKVVFEVTTPSIKRAQLSCPPDSPALFVIYDDFLSLQRLDLATGKEVAKMDVNIPLRSIGVSRDHGTAVGDVCGNVHLLDADLGRLRKTAPVFGKEKRHQVQQLCFSTKEENPFNLALLMAVAGDPATGSSRVAICDLREDRLLGDDDDKPLAGHEFQEPIHCGTINSAGTYLCVGGKECVHFARIQYSSGGAAAQIQPLFKFDQRHLDTGMHIANVFWATETLSPFIQIVAVGGGQVFLLGLTVTGNNNNNGNSDNSSGDGDVKVTDAKRIGTTDTSGWIASVSPATVASPLRVVTSWPVPVGCSPTPEERSISATVEVFTSMKGLDVAVQKQNNNVSKAIASAQLK